MNTFGRGRSLSTWSAAAYVEDSELSSSKWEYIFSKLEGEKKSKNLHRIQDQKFSLNLDRLIIQVSSKRLFIPRHSSFPPFFLLHFISLWGERCYWLDSYCLCKDLSRKICFVNRRSKAVSPPLTLWNYHSTVIGASPLCSAIRTCFPVRVSCLVMQWAPFKTVILVGEENETPGSPVPFRNMCNISLWHAHIL